MNDSFISETEKKQYLLCDGSTYDTTKYRRLYKVLGTNRLPNLQGVFLRGYGSQSSYTSGALGQLQGDAMRKIYGDIPNVQFGESLFGSYNFGAFSLAGRHTWSINGNKPYGGVFWRLERFPYRTYSLSGSPENGYTLQENYSEEKFLINPITTRYTEEYDSNLPDGGYGVKAYRTVTLDSSIIVPTDSEIRPANIAVKYYIRAN